MNVISSFCCKDANEIAVIANLYFLRFFVASGGRNKYFQQGGARNHTRNENIELLQDKFPGRFISRKL